MGKAMMGTGDAAGERRAVEAAEAAISNPLLDDVSMKGARGILINITGGYDMTLYEVDEAANRIREEVDPEANIIFGSTFNEKMNGRMRVSVVATGIDAATVQKKKQAYEELAATRVPLADAPGFSIVAGENNIADESKIAVTLPDVKNMPSEAVEPVKKKSPSLFERLTGLKKSYPTDKREDVVVHQSQSRVSAPDEDLEIPAFLRKN
jgi:cell division protein FtsZ